MKFSSCLLVFLFNFYLFHPVNTYPRAALGSARCAAPGFDR
jgi:hypothetical protein